MASDDSGSKKNKLNDPSRLNAADAKIIFWIIIITIIFTIFLIFYFAIKPDNEGHEKPILSESGKVMTEKDTWFCPFYDNYIGFWDWDFGIGFLGSPYDWKCAIIPEGSCLNYDKDDPDQPREEEEFVEIREELGICPSYVKVSFPMDQGIADGYWNKTYLGKFLTRLMYYDGEMHGYVCEDDLKYDEKCEADEVQIDMDALFNNCDGDICGPCEGGDCEGEDPIDPEPPVDEPDIIEMKVVPEEGVNARKDKTKKSDKCGSTISHDEIIEVYSKKEVVDPAECEKGWVQVVDRGGNKWKNCYVCSDFLERWEETPSECTAKTKYVGKGGVKIRPSASTNKPWLEKLKCGDELEVCNNIVSQDDDCTQGWMKVTNVPGYNIKNESKYVCSNYIQDSKPDDETCGTQGGEEDPPSPTPTPSGCKNGVCGDSTGKNYYAQDNFKGVIWRTDGGYIGGDGGSGCSLIAVANAAKKIGKTPNNPKTLAEYTKDRTKGNINKGKTGWTVGVSTPNMSIEKLMNYVGLKRGSWLWTNYKTPTSTKIDKIRETLKNGGVVIAGGDRNKSSNPYKQDIDCKSQSNKNKGLCVFSNNGHFIAIIGIRDGSNKLIVVNAANGSNGSSINDNLNAETVLKFSNAAISVFPK